MAVPAKGRLSGVSLRSHRTRRPRPPQPSPKPAPQLVLHRKPACGWDEQQTETFWKQGYALEDKRDMKGLAKSYVVADNERAFSAAREPGLQRVRDLGGKASQVLWGHVATSTYPDDCSGDPNPERESLLLVMDGPEKGRALRYARYTARTRIPLFEEGEVVEPREPQGEKPKKGGVYAVWSKSLGQFVFGTPLVCRDIETSKGVTRLNFGEAGGTKLIVRQDMETTSAEDLRDPDFPPTCGSDCVFIPVDAEVGYDYDKPRTPENVSWATWKAPADFRPVTPERLERALLHKTATVRIRRNGGLSDIVTGDRVRCHDLTDLQLVCKLARDLRLPVDEAQELADLSKQQGGLEFHVLSPVAQRKAAAALTDGFQILPDSPPTPQSGGFQPVFSQTDGFQILPDSALKAAGGKQASAYYDPYPDYEEFDDDDGYDQDLDVPVDFAGDDQLTALLTRHQRTAPERRYLDAHGYGGARNNSHGGNQTTVPDEVLLAMRNPIEELQQISERLGQDAVLDHGAVGSLLKTFDAKPFIKEYVDKLESSLDYMGRLLFMLFWKPRDFADLFGADDIPQLENKLDGVFSSYGDLVLELMQAAGEPL